MPEEETVSNQTEVNETDQSAGTQQESQSSEQSSSDQDSDAFTDIDRESLTDEGKVAFDKMRGDYTQKTQAIANQRKQLEAELSNAELGRMVQSDPDLRAAVGRVLGGGKVIPQQETQSEEEIQIPSIEDDPEGFLSATIEQKVKEGLSGILPELTALKDGLAGISTNMVGTQDDRDFASLQKEYPATRNLTQDDFNVFRARYTDRNGRPMPYEDALVLMAKTVPQLLVKSEDTKVTSTQKNTSVEKPNQTKTGGSDDASIQTPDRIQKMQDDIRKGAETNEYGEANIMARIKQKLGMK